MFTKIELSINENIQMNYFCFICEIYFPIKKVFSLGRCSISFHLTNLTNFHLKLWSSSYSSKIVNLISQNFVPSKLNTLLYWKELFLQKEYFFKMNFLFANMKYLYCQVNEASKRTFLLCIEHTFIYSFSLYYFRKVKQQKNVT